jgi:hypothetical protein
MNDDPWRPRKVVIVGTRAVGSNFADALAQSGLSMPKSHNLEDTSSIHAD